MNEQNGYLFLLRVSLLVVVFCALAVAPVILATVPQREVRPFYLGPDNGVGGAGDPRPAPALLQALAELRHARRETIPHSKTTDENLRKKTVDLESVALAHLDDNYAPAAFMETGKAFAYLDDRTSFRRNLTRIVADYPASIFADDARLHLGRLYMDEGKYRQAIRQFNQLLGFVYQDRPEENDAVPYGLFLKWKCYKALGSEVMTAATLRKLKRFYPEHPMVAAIEKRKVIKSSVKGGGGR